MKQKSFMSNYQTEINPIRLTSEKLIIEMMYLTFKSKLAILLVGLCLLIVIPHAAIAAQINVSVDRNPVSLDDSFQITFTASEEPDDDPDFSPLQQDFTILNQSQASSANWVNGKFSKSIQWTLTVMAKNAGSLAIPSIKFGNDASPAKTVLVSQAQQNKDLDTDQDLFLEVSANPTDPYLQSQVLYTVRLYTRIDIAQARLNEPELTDAVIEKLGEDASYTTQVNGIDYSVTERKYAIFPQKSGLLTIKPLELTAEVVAGRRSFQGFFNSPFTQSKRVLSKAISLNVKSAPANTGKHWLPAEQLVLTQEWSGDFTQMKVDEPLTRTIKLEAKGTTLSQLPALNTTQSDGQIKAYPDQPMLKDQKNPDGITALREEKIAIIPSTAGNYTLPAIEIPWFNTHSQKVEIARIPETTITALAGANTQVVAPVAPVEQEKTTSTTPANKLEVATVVKPEQDINWLWVSLFLAVGWLITLVYFLIRRPQAAQAIESKTVTARISTSKESIAKLKKACSANDPIAAKEALLVWGQEQFNVASLGAIADFCEARLRDEILLLNQVLYGKNKGDWAGKKLFQAFTENKARAKLAGAEDKSLEPLYRL